MTIIVNPLEVAARLEANAKPLAVRGELALAGLMIQAAETLRALSPKQAEEQPATNGAAAESPAAEASNGA